ncbi:MAG: pyridine nucleotide-disulfide oxidoreductase, partial [Hyphomicrobiales bacterium]|nr:pyridine nucleotide-disulfide oxidoreductase [Hyphomicrobiales bacterium]
RGKDLEWWMDAAGVLDERYDQVDDIGRARRVPSLQLAGTPDRTTLDLNALTSIGVKLVGRVAGITEDGKAQFAGSLRNMCALSDLKMRRLLDAFDEWARANGIDDGNEPPHRLPPTRVEDSPPLGLDLAGGGIKSIVWATGYRPDYSWLEVPVLDRKGLIRHDGGVVDAPGLYLMGAVFLRRRKSTLIDGAGDDARELSAHLASYLDGSVARMTA